MNKNRLSPITIKKQSIPTSRRQSEAPIENEIESLQEKINKNRFTGENQQIRINELWKVLEQLKEAESQIKQFNESINQFSSVGNNSPERFLKSPKNNQSWHFSTSNKSVTSLSHEAQHLRNQANAYLNRKKQLLGDTANENMKKVIQNKQQLSESIINFEKQLHDSINQVKRYASPSGIVYDQMLTKRIKQTEAFKILNQKKNNYETVIGMLRCVKAHIQDKDLKNKIKTRYEKMIQTSGGKTKKSLKESLIQAQKIETLDRFNTNLGLNNDQILKQASDLKNKLRKIEYVFNSNQIQAENQFSFNFARLQRLKSRIEGTIENYSMQLQKIEQTISLSRPKLYFIQHKDTDLVVSYKKFNEIRQKWQDLQRMLLFQYCNY